MQVFPVGAAFLHVAIQELLFIPHLVAVILGLWLPLAKGEESLKKPRNCFLTCSPHSYTRSFCSRSLARPTHVATWRRKGSWKYSPDRTADSQWQVHSVEWDTHFGRQLVVCHSGGGDTRCWVTNQQLLPQKRVICPFSIIPQTVLCRNYYCPHSADVGTETQRA